MDDLPRDSKILSIILQSVNVDDYDPQCIPMLYEIAYRYVIDVLQDAQVFADHANLKDIDVDALKLAIESRTRFAPAPDSVLLHDLAQKKTRIPLPLVGEKYGLRLPPEKYLLTHQNFIIEPKVVLFDSRLRRKRLKVPNMLPHLLNSLNLLLPNNLLLQC